MRAAISCLVAVWASACAAQGPNVQSPAALLMDVGTGTVLWARAAETPRPMASTTKMMTALLIAESGRLDEEVVVSKKASETPESSLYLKKGERLTLRSVLYGILLRSANDGCVAAAETLDGSVPAFVARMNRRAAELGCRDTHFANPSGLNATGHHSSPRDLALIGRAVAMNPELSDIVRRPAYTIERGKGETNRFLRSRFQSFLKRYPGADGIKTGYTKQAGHCFVGSASRDGLRLLSVVLHSPNVPADTAALLDWGFANYRGGAAAKPGMPVGQVAVARGQGAAVPVTAAAAAYYITRRDAPPVRLVMPGRVKAPVRAGKPLGTARLLSGERQLAAFPVSAAGSVPLSPLWKAMRGAGIASLVLLAGVLIGASSKTARRRRRRLQARGRGADPRGARYGQWEDSDARPAGGDRIGRRLR